MRKKRKRAGAAGDEEENMKEAAVGTRPLKVKRKSVTFA